MSEDNNSELEEHRIDRQRAAMARRAESDSGGRVDQGDSRQAINKGIVAVLTLIIGSEILWVGSTLVGIKESLAALAATSAARTDAIVEQINRTNMRDDRQDIDIRDLQRGVSTIEGRNQRGNGEMTKRMPNGE